MHLLVILSRCGTHNALNHSSCLAGRNPEWMWAGAGDKLVKWSPFKEEPQIPRPCLCPTCQGSSKSKCLNCLGEGMVY